MIDYYPSYSIVDFDYQEIPSGQTTIYLASWLYNVGYTISQTASSVYNFLGTEITISDSSSSTGSTVVTLSDIIFGSGFFVVAVFLVLKWLIPI